MDFFYACISKIRYVHIRGLPWVVKASTLVVTLIHHIWSIQIFWATFIYFFFKTNCDIWNTADTAAMHKRREM